MDRDARLVLEDGRGVDAAGDGASRINLLLHGLLAGDGAVVVNRDHRVVADGGTEASSTGKRGAGSSDINISTRPVLALADAVLGLARTS